LQSESRCDAGAAVGSVPRIDLDQYAAAAAYLTKACDLKEDSRCLYDLAIALLKGKEDQQARAVLEHARDRFPGNPDLLLASAIVAYMTGREAKAESFLEQALSAATDERARAFLLGVLGDLYKAMARFDQALLAYERAVALLPADASLLVRLGALLVQRG